MRGDWYIPTGETPFLYGGQEWVYVKRRGCDGAGSDGYMRHHGDDVVYTDYRDGHRHPVAAMLRLPGMPAVGPFPVVEGIEAR